MSADVKATRKHQPDRLILSVDERRGVILDVIRKARRRLILSLFRCNDEAIFNELAYAVDRGVSVIASRNCAARDETSESGAGAPRTQ